MLAVKDDSAQPLSHLAIIWLLMIPLFFFACRGILWFQAAGGNSYAATGFNSMAASKGGGEVAVFLTITSCVLLPVLSRFTSVLELAWRNKVFAILALYAMSSTLWSQFPRLSLQYGVDAVLNVLFIFYLYTRFSPQRLMKIFSVLGWIIVLGSIAFAVALPQYGVDHRASTAGAWQGLFVFKNTCSIMATFLLSVGFYMPTNTSRDRVLRIGYIVLTIFLVMMTRARTGWIVLAGLLAYVALMKLISRFKANDRVAVLAIIAMVVIPLVVGGAVFYEQILLFLGKDPTLTGRTDIWKLVIISIMKRPWLGYGYRAFWMGLRGESANISLHMQWSVPAAHNGLLEAWLDLGLVGIGLVAFSFLRAVRDAMLCFREGLTPRIQWYCSILVMTLIVNVAEMTIMIPNYLTWMMYVLACVGLHSEAGLIRSRVYEPANSRARMDDLEMSEARMYA